MISEQVELTAADGREQLLEDAVRQAIPLFRDSPGCRSLVLERSVDAPGHYRMTVLWEHLEDHTETFRSSAAFGQWRELVTPHLAHAPTAEHFAEAFAGF